MSFAKELKDFTSSFQAGYKMMDDAEYNKAKIAYMNAQVKNLSGASDAFDAGAKGKIGAVQLGDNGGTGGNGGTPSASADVADQSMQPEQKAFLRSIYGDEAPSYDTLYGGGKFTDFSDHPRQDIPIKSGPNAGKTSSAAGRPQFLGSTWDDQAKKLGLKDFSPANQDKAAWNLASETYAAKTGGQDLLTDLKSKQPGVAARAATTLHGVWTSLPGGIEQGARAGNFQTSYEKYLQGYATPAPAVAAKPSAVPVAAATTSEDDDE